MDTTNDMAPPPARGPWNWAELLKKLAIWGLFLAALYLARDFFFVAFMTFLFCYLTLAVVGLGMRRFSPHDGRPWLRPWLIVGVFVLVPLTLAGVGFLVGPPLMKQVQELAGRMSKLNPEAEVSHLLQGYVGPSQFKDHYGGPDDPRYQKALKDFRETGVRHVQEYADFPKLEAWVEGGFARQFTNEEEGRIKFRLAHEGTSGKEFGDWFVTKKYPELQDQARKQAEDKAGATASPDPLARKAASTKPDELLEQVRRDPALADPLRQEWERDTMQRELAAAERSPAYAEQFRASYERQRERSPATIPYTFEQYVELQKARTQGKLEFGKAVDKLLPSAGGDGEAKLRADFEAAQEHELFQQWWGTSSIAQVIRHQFEGNLGGAGSERLNRVFSSLLNLPVDLSTALILSFFICIDFPRLRGGVRRLQETWLKDVYDEIAPALTSLAHLIGKALHCQGLIAVCNAVMMYFVLRFLGVDHEMLLAAATFVLCLVPTLGAAMAWVLIAVCALVQPGGGVVLALKASTGVMFVILMETFVFSPRILGKAMELHPVLIIALLPIAQYFFGIWGLILATPVAVYVIYVVILRRDLPGAEHAVGKPHEAGSDDARAETSPAPHRQELVAAQEGK
jgi:predicted PurR-regulated permease PerM